jgi:hypothetical protein
MTFVTFERILICIVMFGSLIMILEGKAKEQRPSPERAYRETIGEHILMQYVCGYPRTTAEVAADYDTLTDEQQKQVAWRMVNMMRAFTNRGHGPKFCQCDRCQKWLTDFNYLTDRCREALAKGTPYEQDP